MKLEVDDVTSRCQVGNSPLSCTRIQGPPVPRYATIVRAFVLLNSHKTKLIQVQRVLQFNAYCLASHSINVITY